MSSGWKCFSQMDTLSSSISFLKAVSASLVLSMTWSMSSLHFAYSELIALGILNIPTSLCLLDTPQPTIQQFEPGMNWIWRWIRHSCSHPLYNPAMFCSRSEGTIFVAWICALLLSRDHAKTTSKRCALRSRRLSRPGFHVYWLCSQSDCLYFSSWR